MGKGGGSDSQTTVTESKLPPEIAPHVAFGMGVGRDLYSRNPLYRPDFNTEQQLALQDATNVAQTSALPQAASDFATDQLGMGEDMMARTINRAARPYLEEFTPQMSSAAALRGREGSGVHSELYGQGVGREIAKQYNAMMDRNLKFASLAPSIEESRYISPQKLFDVGNLYEQRIRSQREEPWDRFGRYTGLAFGNAPGAAASGYGTTTSTQPIYRPSPLQQALGFGLTAAGLFL